MSLNTALRELRRLTYSEMMVLAEELNTQLEKERGRSEHANVIADVLSKLNVKGAEPSDLEKQEDKILQEIFRVKRQLVVKWDRGFSISIPTLSASTVVGQTPRIMFPQMIDQIVTMHALTKGMK